MNYALLVYMNFNLQHFNHSLRNMVSCFFALHFLFITFLTFLSKSLSNSENSNYTACSRTYSCGELQNIGYPFWGDNRPKYCGIPELMLNCYAGEGYPYTIMNVIRNYNKYVSYSALTVLGINTHSYTMSFSLKNRLNTCYVQSSKGVALLQTLKPDTNTRNITLFYSCNRSLIDISFSRNQHFYAFNCSNIDYTNGSVYYFVQQSDISKMAKLALCRNYVTFLVNKRGLDELKRTNYSSLSVLTEWPVTMNYTTHISACSKCKKSGGRCGSSGDLVSYTSTFLCYCRDGQQPSVCQNHRKKMSGSLILVLGTGGAILVLVGVVVAILVFWQHNKKKVGHPKLMIENDSFDCSASEVEKGNIYLDVPLFSYSELIEATDNFDHSKELGNGGHGTVYYGRLTDGREVAVKRLREKNCERVQQFMNEVQILTRMKHPNLVTLYGCSSQHCRELLLVYEYVKNGTVSDHLSGKNAKSGSLPWPVRLRIAIETAAALSYLHASGIIHRDVKTNNILLDSNFSVKVADFGLSRLFSNVVTHVSTAPQGTPGYVDPEYSQCYQLTDKSDVYSFGVVLIELISSMPAVDMDRHRHEINLSSYAMKRIEWCAFDELVDPQLGFALDFKVTRMTTLVAELAFRCLQHDKDFRPSMDEVLETLRRIESIDYEALKAEEMANSETLQAEETYQNAQTEDCEVLQTEKTAKYAVVKGVEMCFSGSSNTRTSTEDDHALLLRNFRQYSSSPSSVMENWVSGSTTSSICK